MTRDVVITMQQLNCVSGSDSGKESEEALKFVTDGTWTYENNVGLLKYEETDVTGMQGTHTSLSILPDRIVVSREGTVNSRMEFREGLKHSFLYQTPYGTADLGLDTKNITHSFDDSGGHAEIDYVLAMHHRAFSRNKFIISVEQQGVNTNA